MIQIEMEMVDKCSECRFRTDYDFCSAMPKNFCGNTSDEGKPDWCPLKNVGGWISVKDRLPEKNGRYLCRYEQEVYGDVCRCTDFGMFDSDIGEKGGWRVGKVTHWMPLPAKPKEEEHDCNRQETSTDL